MPQLRLVRGGQGGNQEVRKRLGKGKGGRGRGGRKGRVEGAGQAGREGDTGNNGLKPGAIITAMQCSSFDLVVEAAYCDVGLVDSTGIGNERLGWGASQLHQLDTNKWCSSCFLSSGCPWPPGLCARPFQECY